jgi:hypothetical protein
MEGLLDLKMYVIDVRLFLFSSFCILCCFWKVVDFRSRMLAFRGAGGVRRGLCAPASTSKSYRSGLPRRMPCEKKLQVAGTLCAIRSLTCPTSRKYSFSCVYKLCQRSELPRHMPCEKFFMW